MILEGVFDEHSGTDLEQMGKKLKVERIDKLILIWLWQKEKRYILLHDTCFDLLNQLETDHKIIYGENEENRVLINQLETGDTFG